MTPDPPPMTTPSATTRAEHWQELFWALPPGPMRSKLRSMEVEFGRLLTEIQQLRSTTEAGEPVVSCASCGCVGELTVTNEEDVIQHLHKGEIRAVVPVWTCNVCGASWTGDVAERIRDAAVKAAPLPAPPVSGDQG